MTTLGVGSTSSLEDILLSSDRSVQSQPKLVRKLSLRAVHFLSHASKIPLDCLWFYHEKPRRVMWGIPWSGCVVENSTASGISAASVSEGIVSSLHFFLCCPPPPAVFCFFIFSTDSGEEQKTPFQIHFRVAGRNSLTGAHLGEEASKQEGLRDGLLEGWSYPFSFPSPSSAALMLSLFLLSYTECEAFPN